MGAVDIFRGLINMTEKYVIKKTLFDIEIETLRKTAIIGSVGIWIRDKSGKILKRFSVLETPKENNVWIWDSETLMHKEEK